MPCLQCVCLFVTHYISISAIVLSRTHLFRHSFNAYRPYKCVYNTYYAVWIECTNIHKMNRHIMLTVSLWMHIWTRVVSKWKSNTSNIMSKTTELCLWRCASRKCVYKMQWLLFTSTAWASNINCSTDSNGFEIEMRKFVRSIVSHSHYFNVTFKLQNWLNILPSLSISLFFHICSSIRHLVCMCVYVMMLWLRICVTKTVTEWVREKKRAWRAICLFYSSVFRKLSDNHYIYMH